MSVWLDKTMSKLAAELRSQGLTVRVSDIGRNQRNLTMTHEQNDPVMEGIRLVRRFCVWNKAHQLQKRWGFGKGRYLHIQVEPHLRHAKDVYFATVQAIDLYA